MAATNPFPLADAAPLPRLRARPDGLVTFLVRPNQRPFVVKRYQSFREELRRQAAQGEMHAYSIEYLSAFPDWIGRVGPALLRAPQMAEQAHCNPAFAVELLKMDYRRFADEYEPVVLTSGEHVRDLLIHASRRRLRLLKPEKDYRRALVEDAYYGMLYARETRNVSLSQEIEQWADTYKERKAAAAWHYLVTHPDEPSYHYTRVLRTNPFYYWLCCVQLPARLKASEEDVLSTVGNSAKWAAHFAWSGLHPVALERVLVRNFAWFAQYMIESSRAWNTGQWHRLIYDPVVKANMAYEQKHGESMWFVGLEIAKITLRLYRMFDVEAAAPAAESSGSGGGTASPRPNPEATPAAAP